MRLQIGNKIIVKKQAKEKGEEERLKNEKVLKGEQKERALQAEGEF